MNLTPYAAHWSVFHRRQRADLQILLVSTQPERDLPLADLLSERGYTPHCLSPSDVADVKFYETSLFLSEEAPRAKGSHWIHRPADASKTDTQQAVPQGALDYIHTSIQSEISLERIEVVLDKVLSDGLFGGMINDLKKLVLSGEHPASEILQPFHQHLINLRVAQPTCPAFCVVDSDTERGSGLRSNISSAAAPSIALSPKEAQAHFSSENSSDIALVSVACPQSLAFISTLRNSREELPILAKLDPWDQNAASSCIEAGVTDLVVPDAEGLSISCQRVRRHIQRVRRERYTLSAITELSRLVQQVCPSFDNAILFR